MKPVKTETCNAVFVKDGCFDLPATTYNYDDGTHGIETCWELTDEEVQQIVQNRKVYVYMMGKAVPPMFVSSKCELHQSERKDDDKNDE